ncbi:MAG: diheme cytochrome c [Gallionella sp.]|nr:diheme cytochrome c [Gallionella sp.]
MKWLVSILCTIFLAHPAYADGDKMRVPDNAKLKEECGSCHVVYPPKLLAAADWQRLMSGLDKHFGANAELDAGDNKVLLDFLQRHAGNVAKHGAASMRISDTPWFKREHAGLSAKAWSHPQVKRSANCTACHVNAERGDWSERGIRMPGGLRYEEEGDD